MMMFWLRWRPMMGFPLKDLEVPMMKGSNGIIAIDTDETKEQACTSAAAA